MKSFIATLLLLLSTNLYADGLLVAPTRVVLDSHNRNEQLTLINTGDSVGTFRISLIHLKMNADGSMAEITEPEEGSPFADSLVRFSPREVILEPNVPQTVRVMMRLPADTKAGEYRSALAFREVPATKTAEPEPNPKSISINLTIVYGVSVPVIVRTGTLPATAKVTCQFKEGNKNVLECKLGREGNQSLFGNVTAKYKPLSGSPLLIGTVNAVGVYIPLSYRMIDIPLTLPPNVSLTSGSIVIDYTQDKGVLATTYIPVQ